MSLKNVVLVVSLLLLVAYAAVAQVDKNLQEKIDLLYKKKQVTILVTDSGLGGLSVCAAIEQKLQSHHVFKKVRLVFCNALPEANYGYNKMTLKQQQLQVFDSALAGMVRWYRPDLILIACNTLSVIYNETEFATSSPIPVVSIVGFGVNMVYDRLKDDPAASTIIFGTPTTISQNTHREGLLGKAIAPERIVSMACKDLESEIQFDPQSDVVKTMIQLYTNEAVGQIKNKNATVIAGLCCSHYGYCLDEFAGALRDEGFAHVEVVNPNDGMSQLLFAGAKRSYKNTHVTVEVASRAVITIEEQNSISKILEPVSPRTASALRQYSLRKELFSFRQ